MYQTSANVCEGWGNNVRGLASHAADWLPCCFTSSLNSFHHVVMFSTCMHVSVWPGKNSSGTNKMSAKKILHSSLAAVALGKEHSGESRPFLPDPTLLNLHSYEDLIRHFTKSLILWEFMLSQGILICQHDIGAQISILCIPLTFEWDKRDRFKWSPGASCPGPDSAVPVNRYRQAWNPGTYFEYSNKLLRVWTNG